MFQAWEGDFFVKKSHQIFFGSWDFGVKLFANFELYEPSGKRKVPAYMWVYLRLATLRRTAFRYHSMAGRICYSFIHAHVNISRHHPLC